uniref:Uncharacterized protein n=1 Tax=Rhizophora mucronata TaxID=61149 RepID=A0A2P2NQ35_RHIMU
MWSLFVSCIAFFCLLSPSILQVISHSFWWLYYR